jgi:hypothetical protein
MFSVDCVDCVDCVGEDEGPNRASLDLASEDATLAIGFRIPHVYRQGPQTFSSRSHAPPAIPRLLCHNVRTCGQSVVLTLATCQKYRSGVSVPPASQS